LGTVIIIKTFLGVVVETSTSFNLELYLLKKRFMFKRFKKILGPSLLLKGVKKIRNRLFFRGGSDNDVCISDEAFFEALMETIPSKPRRLSNKEVQELLSSTARLTKEQKIVRSVLEEVNLSKAISEKGFQSIQEMYDFRRKYKYYLRLKRLIPLSLIAPFTTTELSKMAYAAALGSKSISLTLPGLVGYSLPAFFFFHMSGFYAPDKLKPFCQACKITLGAPIWIIGSLTDGLMAVPEEIFFGEEVPIDVVGTGGTIPGDLGDINKIREILDEMRDFSKKTY
jgi:hypothetical protein